MQSLRGTVRANGRRIPGRFCARLGRLVSSYVSCRTWPTTSAEAGTEMMAEERDFDVFVRHTGEDKDTVVRPLEQAYR